MKYKNLFFALFWIACGGVLFAAPRVEAQTIPQLQQWIVDVSGNITQSVSGRPVKINGNLTVTGTCTGCGGGGGAGPISTSSPLVSGQGVYATGVSTIASVATSTPSVGTGIGYSGTLGSFFGGTNGTLTNTGVTSLTAGSGISLSGSTGGVTISSTGTGAGLGTTTPWNAGQLAEVVNNGTITGVSSTSLAVSSPLTVTGTLGALIGGTNSTVNCQTASGSQAGCLASADFNTFNNKQSALTFSTGLTNTAGTVTVNTTQNITTLSNLTTGFVQATAGVLSSAALTSGQVTTALTFTPFGGTNPLPIANGGTASTTALANAIKYFDPTAAFETASTSFVRVASGNVGIGTSTPTTLLYLKGSAAGEAVIRFESSTANSFTGIESVNLNSTAILGSLKLNGATGEYRLFTNSTYFPTFYANGIEAARITTAGNFGIATTSPWAQLSIGMASGTPAFVVGTAGSSSPAFYVSSANGNGFTGFGTSVPDSPVTINMNTSAPPPALGVFTGTTLHTIGADGLANRVVQDSFGAATVYSLRRSDGTNNASTTLGANENIFTFGGAGNTGSGAVSSTKAQLNVLTTQAWTATANGTAWNFLVTPNNSTTLFEAMRIDQSGYLGIGTTTPAWKLDIATSSASTNTGTIFAQVGLTDTSAGVNLKTWNLTSEGGNFYIGTSSDLYASTTIAAFTLRSNGFLGIGSTSPAQQLSVNGIIYSGTGGFQFPDGTIQTTAAAGGSNFFTNSGINTFLSTGTDLGVGSSTPFGELGIHANSGTNYPGNLLFTIGSSTASATTTLLSVSNSGVENLATALVITGNNGIIGSSNSASGISFDAFHSFIADSAGGATFATRFVGSGGLAYSFTARNSGGATLSAISVLNGADTNSGTTALVGIATSSPFGTLSVNMGSTSPAFVIGSAGSSTLAFIVSSANNLGAVGIGSSTPYGQFSDVSASSTDPNRPIATFAGFEAGVANAVQFIIDEWGRPFWHGDTPSLTACGTSPSFVTPSNDVTGIIQSGGGVHTDCTIILAHPLPAGSTGSLFAQIVNSTTAIPLSINQSPGSLTQFDIHGTALAGQDIEYWIPNAK